MLLRRFTPWRQRFSSLTAPSTSWFWKSWDHSLAYLLPGWLTDFLDPESLLSLVLFLICLPLISVSIFS
uniref:Uncharacterized protein n=1 Tax=Arundo donax TaxID=35708 RepID=A0A0A8Y541_ARUDO